MVERVVSQTRTPLQIFMVFDLAEGGDLHDFITKSQGYRCGWRAGGACPLHDLCPPLCRLPEPIAVSFFLQLIEGLQHCHNSGVCHRDLKPGSSDYTPLYVVILLTPACTPRAENILLSKDRKTAMIADFGLAALSKEPVQALPAVRAPSVWLARFRIVSPRRFLCSEFHGLQDNVWNL